MKKRNATVVCVNVPNIFYPDEPMVGAEIRLIATDDSHICFVNNRANYDMTRAGLIKLRDGINEFLDATKPTEKPVKVKTYSGKETYAKLNDGCYLPEKTAGHWREKPKKRRDDHLPFPVKLTLKDFDADAFLKELSVVEKKAQRNHYKGWSTHRWDGSRNGSVGYKYKGWSWPCGYATYIKQGVLPSADFYKFITGCKLKGLPTM